MMRKRVVTNLESEEHIKMVKIIGKFFYQHYYSMFGAGWTVALDIPLSLHKPINVNGYIPDFEAWAKQYYVIGEAKTPDDLNSKRSKLQILTFINELASQNKESVFLLCVRLSSVPDAIHLLRSIPNSSKVKIHLLDITEFDHFHAKH